MYYTVPHQALWSSPTLSPTALDSGCTAQYCTRRYGTPPPPIRTPCQENYPADAHPSAHKSVLESANPRMDSECASGCSWSPARATAPSPGRLTSGVIKQNKSSGGCVDTAKTRSGPQRVRMSSGERPIGAAKGKQSDTEALCQAPPSHTHTAARTKTHAEGKAVH